MPHQLRSGTAKHGRFQEHKCCGIVEDTKYQVKMKREARRGPQPWIVLKLMVFGSIALIGYSAYVYIGRLCVPFIKGRRKAAGIALLVVFSILLLWVLWSYMKVVLTSPGYARDHVPRTPQPQPQALSLQPTPPSLPPLAMSQRGSSDSQIQAIANDHRRFTHRVEPDNNGYSRPDNTGVGGPSYENILLHNTSGDRTRPATATPTLSQPERQSEATETHPPSAFSASSAQAAKSQSRKLLVLRQKAPPKPKVYIARRPPTSGTLLPENRYCHEDGIVKPFRSHHCRHCGTCILRYDHHCPWIGQCVGARNHKFFVNFTEAGGIYCAYVFATILAYTVHDIQVDDASLDPQLVLIIALTGLFGLFTWTLTISHIMLILSSQTTVESLMIRHMKERESHQLNKAYACWDIRSKRYSRKEWDNEWGDLDTEGHIWWMEDRRTAWEDVMGTNIWGWFFPVSRGLNNGTSYPVNPRFDADGRWRRRSEWPNELQ
ncbi:zf-DHHC-domain-containing protein [Amanita rubescens]|nr:zf-DHHC-domain-containing protein [Amanita rubescens]